jgi:SagB-type dehydrogenase family enzyme
MTRFLARIWNDPLCGSFNQETEHLFNYHHATKHNYHSVRMNAHYLDWKNQPNPFRSYEGAPIIPLPSTPGFPAVGTFADIAALTEARPTFESNQEERAEIVFDKNWLSSLLWHSMAISAWKKVPGSGNHRYSLRVNPSSGNLHPTETYLALRGFRDIGDGLYHYRVDAHALELRRPGAATQRLARALNLPWAEDSQLIVALTSVFWREAWKYRDRAYRYCCHDLGHAMMSLLLAARALGLSDGAIAHFGDTRLADELGLTGGDEAPMAFLVFPWKKTANPSIASHENEFAGIPNELSPEEVPYELLLEMHRATVLPDSVGTIPIPSAEDGSLTSDERPASEFPRDPAIDSALGTIVRRRRSALDFDPRTQPMERADLEQLLDFATRDWRADWRGNFCSPDTQARQGSDFVTLFLYIHRVNGYDPGVYRWEMASHSLVQLHRGNVERVAAFLSLEQPLAGNSCFTVSMIANLAKAAEIFGNRGYRYVYFEAGAIGQRLYVGAEALGWNATGIGAFYDDDVHRYLGFLDDGDSDVASSMDAAERGALVMLNSPASRQAAAYDPAPAEHPAVKSGGDAALPKNSKWLPEQVIYHFAVGRAILDPRLEG